MVNNINNTSYSHFKFYEVNPENKSEEMKIRQDIEKGFDLCKSKRKISMNGYSQEIGLSSRTRLRHLIKGACRINNNDEEKLKGGYEKELTLDVCEKELPNLFKKHKYDGSFNPPLKKVRKETALSNDSTFSLPEAGSGNNIPTLEQQPQFLLPKTTQTSNRSPQQNINIEAPTTKYDDTLELTGKIKKKTRSRTLPIPDDLLQRIKNVVNQKLNEERGKNSCESLNKQMDLKYPHLLYNIVNDYTKSVIQKDLIALDNFVSEEEKKSQALENQENIKIEALLKNIKDETLLKDLKDIYATLKKSGVDSYIISTEFRQKITDAVNKCIQKGENYISISKRLGFYREFIGQVVKRGQKKIKQKYLYSMLNFICTTLDSETSSQSIQNQLHSFNQQFPPQATSNPLYSLSLEEEALPPTPQTIQNQWNSSLLVRSPLILADDEDTPTDDEDILAQEKYNNDYSEAGGNNDSNPMEESNNAYNLSSFLQRTLLGYDQEPQRETALNQPQHLVDPREYDLEQPPLIPDNDDDDFVQNDPHHETNDNELPDNSSYYKPSNFLKNTLGL
jgi:hypothetical protein